MHNDAHFAGIREHLETHTLEDDVRSALEAYITTGRPSMAMTREGCFRQARECMHTAWHYRNTTAVPLVLSDACVRSARVWVRLGRMLPAAPTSHLS